MHRIEAIHSIFKPRSIAFIGASNTMHKWGFQIFHNLLMGKFQGKIYPVNPSEKEIVGYRAYPSVLDIADEVDLAIFTIPAEKMPDAIADCVKKGVRAGLVISAGFAELGDEGKRLEREMTRRAQAGGMVLVGPNCQGIACPSASFYPWMPAHFPLAGSIAIVSQSGNLLTWICMGLEDYGFGVSKVVSCGNLCDLGWEDYLLYLEKDPETKVILLYIEGLQDGRRFIEVAKKVNRSKPVIVFKGGKSQQGFRAARSHTGVLAGNDAVLDSACKQAGLLRAETVEEAVCFSAGFVATPLPKGKRLGIVTTGGGLGVLAADLCAQYGIELPEFSPRTRQKLIDVMPPWWAPGNPVDMAAGVRYATSSQVIELLIESGEVDGILFLGLGLMHRWADFHKLSPVGSLINIDGIVGAMKEWDARSCRHLQEIISRERCPVLINSNVAPYAVVNNYKTLVDLLHQGIMVYPSIELSVKAFSALAFYGQVSASQSHDPAHVTP